MALLSIFFVHLWIEALIHFPLSDMLIIIVVGGYRPRALQKGEEWKKNRGFAFNRKFFGGGGFLSKLIDDQQQKRWRGRVIEEGGVVSARD